MRYRLGLTYIPALSAAVPKRLLLRAEASPEFDGAEFASCIAVGRLSYRASLLAVLPGSTAEDKEGTMRRITLLMLFLYGCVPPPPHQFVPGGPLGEAGQTIQGPRQASDEEVRTMLAESSLHQQNPPGRVDLNGLLTQITQATNFRQKQRLVDRYHHAALLLPEAERDQAFQRLRDTTGK